MTNIVIEHYTLRIPKYRKKLKEISLASPPSED
jgi:hypothetical protein